jgi:phage terminase large subunit-like protein
MGDCVFDPVAAAEPILFFKVCLRHAKGALRGQPIILEPWQEAIFANLFGWKRPDGTRRYREAFIYVPKKNGKTTMSAGLANYVLFCDSEPGAECYCAAADAQQASILFDIAKSMVREEPELRNNSQIFARTIMRGRRIVLQGSFCGGRDKARIPLSPRDHRRTPCAAKP